MKVYITGIRSCLGTHLAEQFIARGWLVAGSSYPEDMNDSFDRKNIAQRIPLFIHDDGDYTALADSITYFEPEILIQLDRTEFKNQIPVEAIFQKNLNSTLKLLEIVKKSESLKGFITLSSDHVLSYLQKEEALSEEWAPQGSDMYSASLSARENAVTAFEKQFLSRSRYKTHGKTLSLVRMPSCQCMECAAPEGSLWASIQLAMMSRQKPQLSNPGALRQWYPVLEAAEHLFLLAQDQLESGAKASGVWNFASLTVPTMTVGEYLQTLHPDWDYSDDHSGVVSRHPVLSTDRLQGLVSRTSLSGSGRHRPGSAK